MLELLALYVVGSLAALGLEVSISFEIGRVKDLVRACQSVRFTLVDQGLDLDLRLVASGADGTLDDCWCLQVSHVSLQA